MADIKLNYVSNADQIKQDYKTIQDGAKKISESPVKITMNSKGIQDTIDAMGRLRVEIPKLEQQYNSLQNKNSTVAKQMAKDLKNLVGAFQELNSAMGKGNVSGTVFDSIKNSGGLEAQLNTEKRVTDELLKQQKIRESQEKELDALRVKTQGLMRQISDQQNALMTGKKGKTPYDLANLITQLNESKARAEELINVLGEGNSSVQHWFNGINWTEANNPLRALRDEAYKIMPEMKKLSVEIEKIKASGKDNNLLGFDEQRLKELQETFAYIETEFQKAINDLGDSPANAATKSELQQTLTLLQQQRDEYTKIAVEKQQALNADAQQAQREKEYMSLLQQRFQLENKILNLSKNKQSTKQNANQISEYQKQIELINQKLQMIQNEGKFTDATTQKIEAATEAHKNEQAVINAKNKDIENTNGLLSDSLKNFAKFTLYYAGINALKQGIQQALDTMKELDKAFTDIQLVTGDTDEATAELAQEYNGLAKELGATTVQVAEGARGVA